MTAVTIRSGILVLGVGNTLLQDDGAGVHVIEALSTTCRHLLPAGAASSDPAAADIELVDAGTIGLALLPAVEAAAALIVVDAAVLGRAPGSLAVFRDRDIDRLLAGRRRSVHEVALADLFAAAALRGRLPARRALVAIQPGCTDWGLQPTPAVEAALPGACAAVADLLREWRAPETRCA
ncbi:MAG: hydrogenase maturation protease [Xanthomonadales bacterium]|nr:hydrogenase maturation protease [Xanthomonadales bacterium]